MHRKSLFSLFAVIFTVTLASAQIKAVEKFVSENEEGLQKFFIYQSSLRMLNQNGDDDFNRLIKDIRKINVYIAENSGSSPKSDYQRMVSDLTSDDFETLVSVKNGGMHLNLLGKETGDRAWYVLAATEDESVAVLEMDGKLDLRYLQSLDKVNFDKLKGIVGMDEEGASKGNGDQKKRN